MFGAGGGTSSYRDIQETDVILLWGSNARETHPIFFHHLLHGVRNGARLIVVDPRRTSSAQWADAWLGLDVGSDVALSNAMAREIIASGLHHRSFIEHSTSGFAEYAASVEPYTLEEGERLTGVPAAAIRDAAHTYARADRGTICWTLGITEHHNAVDNVLALINLGLLCGNVGREGTGLSPLRGQNNVQGGGDMGAIPNKLSGFQDIERDADARARFEAAWGVEILPHYGWHLTQMFHAMERRRADHAVLHRREPGPLRGRHQPHPAAADGARVRDRPGHLVHQDRRVRRRGVPLDRLVVRDRGHRDQLGAARAARPQGARRARRDPRRHLDPGRAGPPDGARLGRPDGRADLGRAALALADARRHVVRPARGRGRPAVAVRRRGRPGRPDPARPALGRTRWADRPRRSRSSSTSRRSRPSTPTTRCG